MGAVLRNNILGIGSKLHILNPFETKRYNIVLSLENTCLGGGGEDEEEREGGDVHTSVSFSFSPAKKYMIYNLIYCNIGYIFLSPSLFLLQTEQGCNGGTLPLPP